MKYIAYAVRRDVGYKFSVCGQNNETFNWDIIERGFDFIPAANDAANVLACKASFDYKCYIPVYGLGGYGIGEWDKGFKYKK